MEETLKGLTKSIITIIDTFSIFNYTFGLFGNILCILVFHRQSKEVKPYVYQIIIIINDTINGVIHILYRYLAYHKNPWSLQLRGGRPLFDWRAQFRKNYFLVWLAGSPTTFIIYIFSMAAPVLLIGCTYDRILAVLKPIQYRKFKHKRRAGLLALFAVCVPCLLTWPRLFRFDAINDRTLEKPAKLVNVTYYRAKVPKTWGTWQVWKVFSSMALAYTIAVFVALTVIIVAWVYYYRKTYQRMKDKKTMKNMRHHRTMGALILCQFFLLLIPNVLTIIVWMGDTWLAKWLDDTAYHSLLKQVNNLFKGIQINWNFIPYVIISATFRRGVKKVLGLKMADATVTPTRNPHVRQVDLRKAKGI